MSSELWRAQGDFVVTRRVPWETDEGLRPHIDRVIDDLRECDSAAEIEVGSRRYQGRLRSIAPEVEGSQVRGLIAFVGEGPEGLRQNQRVTTRLILESRTGVLKVKRGPFLDAGGDPLALISKWRPEDRVLIVDAVRSGATLGAIHRFDSDDRSMVPAPAAISSHGIGVAELLDLARMTGRRPARLVFYGIEGSDFDVGEELSAPVERALAPAAARIHAELERWLRH